MIHPIRLLIGTICGWLCNAAWFSKSLSLRELATCVVILVILILLRIELDKRD